MTKIFKVFIVVFFVLIGFLAEGLFLNRSVEKKPEEKSFFVPSSSSKAIKKGKKAAGVDNRIIPTVAKEKVKECALVVYWLNFSSLSFQNYEKFLYFGIAPDLTGGIAQDQGFKKIDSFVKFTQNKGRALVVRLVDKRLAESFLEKKEIWRSFLDKTFSLAAQKGFLEVAFDIEFSPFQEDLKGPLVEFLSEASKEAKKRNLKLSFIAYADSFYRKRPFDFEKISRLVDEVYLMAYDFTKSFGEPGPNFPLKKGDWGYWLLQAVEDFGKFFGREKMTVVFGGFGYKWNLSEDGRPLARAKALSFNSIKKNYLQKCAKEESCRIELDETAGEKVLKARDFVIWYEDKETFKLKKERLRKEGIGSFCYFALGYF